MGTQDGDCRRIIMRCHCSSRFSLLRSAPVIHTCASNVHLSNEPFKESGWQPLVLVTCFFLAVFFRGFRLRVAVGFLGVAALSAARFRAQRLFVASEMARRPAALMRCLFLGRVVASTAGPLFTVLAGCVISRSAEIARSIASRCCSKSERFARCRSTG